MLKFISKLLLTLLLAFSIFLINAQEPLPRGSLEVSGRIRIEKKSEKLKRKRFYIFRGGLEENKNLIERLKSAEIVSRDCYYSQMKASPQYICWLQQENCESPYCRSISDSDIETVPEFKAAFQKGLGQFGKSRPEIAQKWLTTNLNPNLRDRYYKRLKTLLDKLLNGEKPLQSSMTDSVTVKAIFIDIPLNLTGVGGEQKETETFLVSNILPFEIGEKSYIWACEIEISNKKTAKMRLDVPDGDKPVKGCEVIVKDLPVCKTEDCKK
jgi:hypothetical protein